MAHFANDTQAIVQPKQLSHYNLVLQDLKRCEPETRDKMTEAIECLEEEINTNAYTVIYDSIDEYEMEAETYDDQRRVIDEIKEIVESNSSQRTLGLIYYRGKRIKYEIFLNHG
jgi:ribonuclease HII